MEGQGNYGDSGMKREASWVMIVTVGMKNGGEESEGRWEDKVCNGKVMTMEMRVTNEKRCKPTMLQSIS